MIKRILGSEKGFSIIGFIFLFALAFAALNAYAYFNPKSDLSKYTLVNILNNTRDRQRIRDLKTLEAAVVAFYDKNNQMPTVDGWCGRISTVLHPEFILETKAYLPNYMLPHDPTYANSSKDYFYYRVDRSRYILMAVLDTPSENYVDNRADYNFVKCHDWPGNYIYNYQLRNF